MRKNGSHEIADPTQINARLDKSKIAKESWDFWFNLLQLYVSEYGTSHVPVKFVTADGSKLGGWANNQKDKYRKGKLILFQRDALEHLPGWEWEINKSSWEGSFNELLEFKAKKGHVNVPKKFVTPDGFKLGVWVMYQRQLYHKGEIYDHRKHKLEELTKWTWSPRISKWEFGLQELSIYYRVWRGNPPRKYVSRNGFKLGTWVARQRERENKLSLVRKKLLEQLPYWTWNNSHESQWELGYHELLEFVKNQGHAKVPYNFISSSGFRLSLWVSSQRQSFHQGKLADHRKQKLEGLTHWVWNVRKDHWDEGYKFLIDYLASTHQSYVPYAYITKTGFKLGCWVHTRRAEYRKGRLSIEKRLALERLPGWNWKIAQKVS